MSTFRNVCFLLTPSLFLILCLPKISHSERVLAFVISFAALQWLSDAARQYRAQSLWFSTIYLYPSFITNTYILIENGKVDYSFFRWADASLLKTLIAGAVLVAKTNFLTLLFSTLVLDYSATPEIFLIQFFVLCHLWTVWIKGWTLAAGRYA